MTAPSCHVALGRLPHPCPKPLVFPGWLKAVLSPTDTMLRHLRATDAMKNFSEFRQEASMLHALQHPCIVSLIGISIHPLCFALELAPLSSLNTVLSENAKGTGHSEGLREATWVARLGGQP